MRSQRTLPALAIGVATALLLAVLARNPIGEAIEGPAFSMVLAIGSGLAIGACLILALGARRARA
jgi:hypothetical protein